MSASTRARADAFCARYGLRMPILLAPMAGVGDIALSVAVARAGGMAALGALPLAPTQIAAWMSDYRAQVDAPCQVNLWIPDPTPRRDASVEDAMRAFLSRWGPVPATDAGDAPLQDFDAQCEAVLAARPAVISSIMGVFPPPVVARARTQGIAWFACATTVEEARAAEQAGADAIVVQGVEAGGHRGAFDAARAERHSAGLFALLPHVADRVQVPVIAAGAIGDGRGIAAALTLGASAVQIGTAFLRTPEAGVPRAWADALDDASPDDTMQTRAFSGRLGRSLATAFARAAAAPITPAAAAYPVQRGLTAAMRADGVAHDALDRIQAWAGQAAALAREQPAAELVATWWSQADDLL